MGLYCNSRITYDVIKQNESEVIGNNIILKVVFNFYYVSMTMLKPGTDRKSMD